MTEPILALRLLIAADNALARAGLAALLSDTPELLVVGQTSLDDELEAAIDLHRPDVVVCDLGYDAAQSAERLAEAAELGPALVALFPHAAAEAASLLLGAGVRGLLLQTTAPGVLATALLAVGRGLTVLGPDVAPGLWSSVQHTASSGPTVGTFTPREREVLALLAEGLANKQIARRLHISEHTVKFHVNALLTKLGAASRTEAVVRATRLGMIAL